jgi:uncharacterized protein (TIGR01777 family)
MKIAITGGTGFIGIHLVDYLRKQGHQLIIISRAKPKNQEAGIQYETWQDLKSNPGRFEGTDAIVNLAGESINQRWTDAAKSRILESRWHAAKQVADLVATMSQKPSVVINAAGMSIYGTSLTETFDEYSESRIQDFLSSVCEKWEEAADLIPAPRLVKLRTGLVLGRDGGAFPKMAFPYRIGVGGKVGSGQQWISWIHIHDIVRLIEFCILESQIQGPVNATTPHPVTNDQFGRILAQVLHRPHWFPVPAFLMKIVFGELSTLLLDGQRVIPKKSIESQFEFRYPTLQDALKQICS